MDILSLLKSMDKETLAKSIRDAQAFLSTPEGQNAAKMLSNGKMPDGGKIPDNLKEAAEAIRQDENAQKILRGIVDK